jgi:hypothetical protein
VALRTAATRVACLRSVVVLPEPSRFPVEPRVAERAVRPDRDADDVGTERRLLDVEVGHEVAPAQSGDHVRPVQPAELPGLVLEIVEDRRQLVQHAALARVRDEAGERVRLFDRIVEGLLMANIVFMSRQLENVSGLGP